ncbi:hypothetical protein BX666DRAFT_1864935 [Dichotomocladium elegans]|nr:hypothetical protein BX666DRAFT_1864935 [Dichotomocladium elegans]
MKSCSLQWTFLIPICIGGAISVAVSVLIWPEDSMTNFMNVLVKGLEGHDAFFQEHSKGFYSLTPESTTKSLPSLHDRLQGCMLMLIDCKRAVHRDILFSHLNGSDVSKLVKVIKAMRTPLHGVGLSYVLKQDLYRNETEVEYIAIEEAIKDMVGLFNPLTEACGRASADVCDRLRALHPMRPRSTLSSFMWPFPRLFWTSRNELPKDGLSKEYHMTSKSLSTMLDSFASKADATMWSLAVAHDLHKHEAALHLIGLYRYQLRNYVQQMVVLLQTIEELEQKRHRRRLWFPTVEKLKKRYWGALPRKDEGAGLPPDDLLDLNLTRTNTRREANNDLEKQRDAFIVDSGKVYYRDPDVDPPATRIEYFFFRINQLHRWMMEPNTIMSIKVASGAVLLSIPFYLRHTAEWYYDWRGNWAIIILLIWMTPTSGMFLYANFMRILGTAAGGIGSIVVWEISRGNPYGLAVVLFVYFMLVYYIFVHIPAIRMFAVIATVTAVLVITYSYDYKMGLLTSGSSEVWTIAGKRMLLVLIGFVAATILSLVPAPVNARVELRKSLAHTLRDISRIYSFLTSAFLCPSIASSQLTEKQAKWLRRRAIDLRRQISDERTYLHLSRYEPPLRGKFPAARYKKLLEAVDALTDLATDMVSEVFLLKNKQTKEKQ